MFSFKNTELLGFGIQHIYIYCLTSNDRKGNETLLFSDGHTIEMCYFILFFNLTTQIALSTLRRQQGIPLRRRKRASSHETHWDNQPG